MKKLMFLTLVLMQGIGMAQAQKAYTYIKQNDAYVEADGVSQNTVSTTQVVSLSYDSDGNGIMKVTGSDNVVGKLDVHDMIDGGVLAADFTKGGNGVTRYKDDTQYVYATIYSPFQLVVPDNDNLEVYAATYDDGERTIVLKDKKLDAGKIVPVGRCLVMKRKVTDTSFDFTFSTGTPDVETENYLFGTAVEKTAPETTSEIAPYVEGVGNISGKEGFFRYTGLTLGAGKVYVMAKPKSITTPSGAKRSYLAYDEEETTGIDNVQGVSDTGNQTAYNAMGQRVKADAKGMVIINNKKYVNK